MEQRANISQSAWLLRLPTELLEHILCKYGLQCRLALQFVCKDVRDASSNVKQDLAGYVLNPNIIEWAWKHGHYILDNTTCARVAFGGHLATLKWLRDSYCPWNENTCISAIEGGHLDVLEWAIEYGCPHDGDYRYYGLSCIDAAAYCGQLHILEWLRQIGYNWGERTCYYAAAGGYLHVLKWARQNGCPWGRHAFPGAACDDHFRTLKGIRYTHNRLCGRPASPSVVCYDHLKIRTWARQNDCPWQE